MADVAAAQVPALELHAVSIAFGGLRALNGVTMSVPEKQITGLIGPNGAGKTTIFNVITGMLPPDEGTVSLYGQPIQDKGPVDSAHLGVGRTFQDLKLFAGMSVVDNVRTSLPGQLGERLPDALFRRRRVRKERNETYEAAMEILRQVGLADKHNVMAADLGYADSKILVLARLLAVDARVVLLDEPCSGLDRKSLDGALQLIRSLVDQGRTVCLVEHNMWIIRELADNAVFLDSGEVVAQGDVEEVMSDPVLQARYLNVPAQSPADPNGESGPK